MTPAQSHILAKLRAGQTVTPADTVQTIACRAELDAYAAGLKARGAYTTDAMQAVHDRARQIGGGG